MAEEVKAWRGNGALNGKRLNGFIADARTVNRKRGGQALVIKIEFSKQSNDFDYIFLD